MGGANTEIGRDFVLENKEEALQLFDSLTEIQQQLFIEVIKDVDECLDHLKPIPVSIEDAP